MRGSHTFAKTLRSALALALLAPVPRAQTLAHHNWSGSGLSAEPWWRSAVYYRIRPATFQDSDGDGKGDLRGIAQRMAYLQSLSVDAVVLQLPVDETGFDDLVREASSHHIRLLVSLSSADSGILANAARLWLTRGCAGIWLQVPAHADPAQTTATLQMLRKLTDSFPGQRVLVEDTSADPATLALPGAQLVTRAIIASVSGQTDALSLRVQINAISNTPHGSAPIVLLQNGPAATAEHAGLDQALGSALFLTRGAAVLDAGQEIGFETMTAADRVMQWTPSNVTRAPEPQESVLEVPQPPARRPENEYGAFVPYVAPSRKQSAAAKPDLDALPGFSSTAVAAFVADDHPSIAKEDADPNSLLNFYRKLSQLHHENATLRSGGTLALNRDADDVLVWMRTPPAGAAEAVFVAVNLGDIAKTISLSPEYHAGARSEGLLPLLSSSPRNVQVLQRPTAVTLAPRSVVVLGANR